MIYFRTYAKEHGCDCLDQGDLAVWNWIRKFQQITIWERQDEDTKAWKHNHIENKYDANATSPTPRFPLQVKAWKGGRWQGIKGKISCYHVVTAV